MSCKRNLPDIPALAAGWQRRSSGCCCGNVKSAHWQLHHVSNRFRIHLGAGTGKTLSLICSVLQWLEDKREAEAAVAAAIAAGTAQPPEPTANGVHMVKPSSGQLLDGPFLGIATVKHLPFQDCEVFAGAADADDEPDWMKGHAAARKAADAVAAEAARRARIAAAQARAKAAQQRRASRKVALHTWPISSHVFMIISPRWRLVSRSWLASSGSDGELPAAAASQSLCSACLSAHLQEAAARAASAGEGSGDPDAEFVLDEWDSDGGRPGAKRSAAAMQ